MYDWVQTNTSVTITVPIPYKIERKKVDYVITEAYVKLNIPEMRKICFIDLLEPVDINISKMVIEENKILFILTKVKEGLWKELQFNGTKEEKRERRKKAEEKYNEKVKQDREIAEKKKSEFEHFVTEQSIKIDDEKRELIRGKKNAEKTQAEKDLYNFVKTMEQNEKKPQPAGVDEDDIPVVDTSKTIYINNKEEKAKKSEEKPKIIPKEESKIFDDKDLIKEVPTVQKKKEPTIPTENSFKKAFDTVTKEPPKPVTPAQQAQIRQQQNIQVNLTKKKFPTYAARESLAKEPPYPKSKQFVPEKNYLGQEIEDRNPIWTKERADNFYKNHDFRSAINAYNKALDLDPTFHKCLINRGTAYMSIGEFDKALDDFQKAIDLIDKIDAKEKEDAFYDKIMVRALTKTYAVYAFKQEYAKALEIINDKLLIKAYSLPFIIPEDIWNKIKKDKELIENRMKNESLKIEGDKYLSEKQFDKAKEIYLQILSNEPNNEKVLSNLSLIYLNEKNYDEVIKCCTKIIHVFTQFKEKIKIRNMNNTFEIKVLLRRAKCYEILNEMSKAEKDIESIEKLEIKNELILKDIKSIKDKLKIRVVESYKQSANDLLSKGEFAEALNFYDKAVALIKYSNIYNKIDLVKILLNRTGCLIKLTQYDKTYDEFEKVLMILSKQKAIADIQSNIIMKNELLNLEFLTYVKRAFVYSTNGRVEDAIKDYESALKIKPDDAKIKDNLAKLKIIK